MPILRETRDLKAEIPKNLQIENPPRFIVVLHLPRTNPATRVKTNHRPYAAAKIVTEVHSAEPNSELKFARIDPKSAVIEGGPVCISAASSAFFTSRR